MKRLFASCLLLLAMQFGVTLKAQDLRRQLQAYSNTSIIRQYEEDRWLCYNYSIKGNEFYMVSSNGSQTPLMMLKNDNLQIMDFEIFNNMVYFCGHATENNVKSAVLGFFPLGTFPNSPVEYDIFHELASFNRLDVFTAEDQIHVVLTATVKGIESRMVYTIVDARENNDGSWIYCVLDNKNIRCDFDDVAVSNNRVYFTARSARDDVPDAYNSTELWYFDKPVLYGVPLFLNTVQKRFHYNWPVGPVLIEHLYDDRVAMVLRKYPDDLVYFMFNGYSFTYTCKLIFDNSAEHLDIFDIKYNRPTNKIDVLTGNRKESLWNSRIFTFHMYSWLFPVSIPVREFPGHEVQSLDYNGTMPDYYVASGHDIGENLNVYRYNQPDTGNCFPFSSIESKIIMFNSRGNEEDIEVVNYLRYPILLQSEPDSVWTETKCE